MPLTLIRTPPRSNKIVSIDILELLYSLDIDVSTIEWSIGLISHSDIASFKTAFNSESILVLVEIRAALGIKIILPASDPEIFERSMSKTIDAKAGGAVECRGCTGTGNCPRCKGSGMDPVNSLNKCRRCRGNGICTGCNGSGWIVIPIIQQ